MRLLRHSRSSAFRSTTLTALALAGSLLAAGCGGSDASSVTPAGEAAVVRVSGSGSASSLLDHMDGDYRRARTGPALEFLEGTDSGGGIKAVSAGAIEVGALSRDPKPGELEAGMTHVPVARDAAAS